MPSIISIPLAKLKEKNIRSAYDPEELRFLAASLQKRQLVPLIVSPPDECGVHTIYDGHRRKYAALRENKPPCLDCIVLGGDVTEARIKEIQLETALHRTDLTSFEVYTGCKAWMELHDGATAKMLAQAVSLTESYISKIFTLDGCIPQVKEAAAQGKIGVSDWYAMSKVGEAEQLGLLTAKLNGLVKNRDQLERQTRKARNGFDTVRVSRVNLPLPGGKKVVLAGEEMTLDGVIETLQAALDAAKKASKEGLDVKTAVRVWADKAKVGE